MRLLIGGEATPALSVRRDGWSRRCDVQAAPGDHRHSTDPAFGYPIEEAVENTIAPPYILKPNCTPKVAGLA